MVGRISVGEFNVDVRMISTRASDAWYEMTLLCAYLDAKPDIISWDGSNQVVHLKLRTPTPLDLLLRLLEQDDWTYVVQPNPGVRI